ncbi:hypothetical protein GCM10027425_25040 [Alteromonas gracilis]
MDGPGWDAWWAAAAVVALGVGAIGLTSTIRQRREAGRIEFLEGVHASSRTLRTIYAAPYAVLGVWLAIASATCVALADVLVVHPLGVAWRAAVVLVPIKLLFDVTFTVATLAWHRRQR